MAGKKSDGKMSKTDIFRAVFRREEMTYAWYHLDKTPTGYYQGRVIAQTGCGGDYGGVELHGDSIRARAADRKGLPAVPPETIILPDGTKGELYQMNEDVTDSLVPFTVKRVDITAGYICAEEDKRPIAEQNGMKFWKLLTHEDHERLQEKGINILEVLSRYLKDDADWVSQLDATYKEIEKALQEGNAQASA
jgi:hypothetical protein